MHSELLVTRDLLQQYQDLSDAAQRTFTTASQPAGVYVCVRECACACVSVGLSRLAQ